MTRTFIFRTLIYSSAIRSERIEILTINPLLWKALQKSATLFKTVLWKNIENWYTVSSLQRSNTVWILINTRHTSGLYINGQSYIITYPTAAIEGSYLHCTDAELLGRRQRKIGSMIRTKIRYPTQRTARYVFSWHPARTDTRYWFTHWSVSQALAWAKFLIGLVPCHLRSSETKKLAGTSN